MMRKRTTRSGEFPQLIVDEREQLGGGFAVTGHSGIEEVDN